MLKVLITPLFLLITLFAVISLTTQSFATTAGFKPGEIMSDAVMINAKSMSTSQIQNFLNSKVPTCDTNGTQLSEYGGPDLNKDGKVQRWEWGKANYNQTTFTCLRNWKNSSGVSAAQIIYNKAQAYSINPQSLIVLLQKEQGLITDTWPLNIQYRTATGYGCPDTAPCDSQYYGLENQLDWAAKMYHSIITQDPNWYSPYIKGYNPVVYWHPDTGRCGSAPLTMSNWTTASLYSYTPYRPNQASLNAGYGTGDSCSSYGNRNFYNYFTDWFGSTTYSWAAGEITATVYSDPGRTQVVSPSASLLSGQKLYVTVRAKNTGSQSWGGFVHVGTSSPRDRHSSFQDSSWLNYARPTGLVEASTAPNATGTFQFTLSTPKQNGNYTESFSLVADGKSNGWMNGSGFTITANIQNPYNSTINSVAFYRDTAYESRKSVGTLSYGEKIFVEVKAENTGTQSWGSFVNLATSNPNDRHSSFQDSSWLNYARPTGLIEPSVAPGQVGTFRFSLNAPSNSDVYEEGFAIVADGKSNGWMPASIFTIPTHTTPTPKYRLYHSSALFPLERLRSPDGGSSLVMQNDGNLVIYHSGKPIWASRTGGGAFVALQNDGNLVVYNTNGKPLWSSRTGSAMPSTMVIQNDGNLVIYRNGKPVWASKW